MSRRKRAKVYFILIYTNNPVIMELIFVIDHEVMFGFCQVENRELDEKLKQDDSESDQSERSKVTSSSPTSVGGRRESSSSRTTEVKETKKEEKVTAEDTKNDDIEEINYKEMLNR